MVVKKSVMVASLIFLILPIVLATTTPITVYAPLQKQLTITVLDPNQVYYSYQSFPNKDTGGTGEVAVDFTSDQSIFDVALLVKQDGQKIKYTRMQKAFPAGNAIVIDFTGEEAILVDPKQKENTSENTSASSDEASSDENTTTENIILNDTLSVSELANEDDYSEKISGSTTINSTIANFSYIFSNTNPYIIGGFVILILIIVIFGLFWASKDPFKEFASKKHREKVNGLEIIPRGSFSKSSEEKSNKIRDAEILDAERKLDEARKVLEKLKR